MAEADETGAPERRQRMVVDRDLQLFYLTTWVVAGLVIAASFVLLRTLGSRFTFWDLVPVVLILAFAPAMGIQSILHLHRIAGPAEHLRQGLQKLRAGNFDYLMRFRKGDYMKSLAEEYNLLAEELRTIRAAVVEAKEHAEQGDLEALRPVLERVAAKVEGRPPCETEAKAEKPAEDKAEEMPAEEKPAEEKGEEKPAEEKAEEKPAEEKGEEKPAEEKAEETPAEEKGEEKPAEEKAEETPAEETPAEEKAEEAPPQEKAAEGGGEEKGGETAGG